MAVGYGRFKIDVLGTPITVPLCSKVVSGVTIVEERYSLLTGTPPNGVGIAGHALVYSRREVGFGRTPRQPGQVRKEAAVTSLGSGRCPTSHLKGAA